MKIRHIDLGEHPVLLAPMEDVTDPAFRLMCKKFGADMVYTEFVSADALIRRTPRSHPDLRKRYGNNGRGRQDSGRSTS